MAVWQNVQPMAQPTCDETQRVNRDLDAIATVSTLFPSCIATKNLRVPSSERPFQTIFGSEKSRFSPKYTHIFLEQLLHSVGTKTNLR